MKRLLLALIFGACLVSCKEIVFREPQPRGKKTLKSVPKELHGKYLTQKETGEFSEDTVVITARGYRFGYFNPSDKADRYDVGILSDSLVLKTFKGYYFLNIDDDPEWLLRVIKPESNGDLVYMAPEQKGVDFKNYVAKLSSEIRIDSTTVKGEMLYYINPSPGQLVSLIEKGYFSRTVLKKIR